MKRRISEVEEDGGAWNRQTKQHLDDEPAERGTTYKLSYPPKDRPVAQVPFQQPSQLLSFSYNSARELEFTDASLRYYVHPPQNADLRYGYERWVKRPEEKGRLDGLLKAVSKFRSRLNANGSSGDAWLRDISVVSWRGVMTKILTAPYEERDGWEMNVMIIDGTIYLEEHLSDAKLVEKENMTPHHRLQSYFGYSFESYCTSSQPDRREVPTDGHHHANGWGGDVDTNVQWCSVVKTKLGNDRLVIGGEVDCVRGKYLGKTDTFVELKTSLNIRGPQDEAKFEKKLLKFYFQSFLLGVPEIVVGFRKPSGQLTTVQSFQTIQLPRLVRGKPGAWDPSICLKWGEQFIRFLKSTASESRSNSSSTSVGPDTDQGKREQRPDVWRVKFVPGTGVSAARLDKAAVEDVEAGEERVGFLPKWYLQELGLTPGEDFTAASHAGTASSTSVTAPPPAAPTTEPPVQPKSEAPPPIPAGWSI